MSGSNGTSLFQTLIGSMDQTENLKADEQEKVHQVTKFFKKVLLPNFEETFSDASLEVIFTIAIGNPSFDELHATLMSMLFTGASMYHMWLIEQGVDLSKIESLADDQQQLG